jgi:2-keto-4-pentenoate hydratase/2-oxohepta-3-ene-1,7-dioic acid hydratase in catechol pathway
LAGLPKEITSPGLLEPGDDVEIWYEGIGTLRNPVVGPGEMSSRT